MHIHVSLVHFGYSISANAKLIMVVRGLVNTLAQSLGTNAKILSGPDVIIFFKFFSVSKSFSSDTGWNRILRADKTERRHLLCLVENLMCCYQFSFHSEFVLFLQLIELPSFMDQFSVKLLDHYCIRF